MALPFFKKTRTITVSSPLRGTVMALEEVPDRAFAEKMMGEGAAVLPLDGELRAPVSGIVDTLAETGHAVGLRSDDGVEVLVHVGMETVNLKGALFSPCVVEGDRVRTGDLLIRFDLEAIRAAGYELATPVTVVNGDEFGSVRTVAAGKVSPGDPLLEITGRHK